MFSITPLFADTSSQDFNNLFARGRYLYKQFQSADKTNFINEAEIIFLVFVLELYNRKCWFNLQEDQIITLGQWLLEVSADDELNYFYKNIKNGITLFGLIEIEECLYQMHLNKKNYDLAFSMLINQKLILDSIEESGFAAYPQSFSIEENLTRIYKNAYELAKVIPNDQNYNYTKISIVQFYFDNASNLVNDEYFYDFVYLYEDMSDPPKVSDTVKELLTPYLKKIQEAKLEKMLWKNESDSHSKLIYYIKDHIKVEDDKNISFGFSDDNLFVLIFSIEQGKNNIEYYAVDFTPVGESDFNFENYKWYENESLQNGNVNF